MIDSNTPPPIEELSASTDGTLHYVVIADASGSMTSAVSDVREAINAHLIDLQNQPKAWVSVRVFDHRLMTVHDCVRPADAPPLTEDDYNAWGSTALYDAVAKTLLDTDTRISASGGLGANDKVVVLVFSDGMENASQEFSRPAFKHIMENYSDRENWMVIMVGSDWATIQDMENAHWRKENLVNVKRGREKEGMKAALNMAVDVFENRRASFQRDDLDLEH